MYVSSFYLFPALRFEVNWECEWHSIISGKEHYIQVEEFTSIEYPNAGFTVNTRKWENFYFNIKMEKPFLIWLRYVINVSQNGYCVEIWV